MTEREILHHNLGRGFSRRPRQRWPRSFLSFHLQDPSPFARKNGVVAATVLSMDNIWASGLGLARFRKGRGRGEKTSLTSKKGDHEQDAGR